MFQRTFHLYAKGDGAFEVIPSGWSFLAALLGPIWAIANGVFLRYLAWMCSLVPAALVAALAGPFARHLFVAYYVGVLLIYVPMQAFGWRGAVLRGRGYELRGTVVARSSREALRTYAVSVA